MSLTEQYRRGFHERGAWREVLNLVEYLPTHSHYKVALAEDDELAAELLRRGHQPTTAKAPPLTEWTPEVAAMTNLADLVNSLRWLYQRTHGGKLQHPAPSPRPITAMQRARANQRRDNHARLTHRLLANQPPDTADPDTGDTAAPGAG